LTACTGFKVYDDWGFQIKCKSFVIFTDNYHKLRLLNIVQSQWGQLTSWYTDLVLGYKTSWADNRDCDIVSGCALKPAESVVLSVSKQSPFSALFETGQAALEVEQIG
jgi:uncharacterized SAM-binding protein YcdF (DUF218 family)